MAERSLTKFKCEGYSLSETRNRKRRHPLIEDRTTLIHRWRMRPEISALHLLPVLANFLDTLTSTVEIKSDSSFGFSKHSYPCQSIWLGENQQMVSFLKTVFESFLEFLEVAFYLRVVSVLSFYFIFLKRKSKYMHAIGINFA